MKKWIMTEAVVLCNRYGYYVLMVNDDECVVPVDIFHKFCSYPSDLLSEDGKLKEGAKVRVVIKKGKNGELIYPDHRLYYHSSEKLRVCNQYNVSTVANSNTAFVRDLDYCQVANDIAGFINAGKPASILVGVDMNEDYIPGIWYGFSEKMALERLKDFWQAVLTKLKVTSLTSKLDFELITVDSERGKFVLLIKITPGKGDIALVAGEMLYLREGAITNHLVGDSLLSFYKQKFM